MAKFRAQQRCYVAGSYLEGGQDIELSPADSFRQKNNKNLELVDGEVPSAPKKGEKLAEGDSKVGPAPDGLRLLQPAGGPGQAR